MSEPTPAATPEPTPYSAAPVGGAPAQKAPILSIISLVLGILGFLGGAIVFIPFVGSVLQLFFPAGAIVLGILGKKKEPNASKGLWLTGIILGAVGILIAIIGFIGWAVLFATTDTSSFDPYNY